MMKDLPSLFIGFSTVALFGVLLIGGQASENQLADSRGSSPVPVESAPARPIPVSPTSESSPVFAINSSFTRLP